MCNFNQYSFQIAAGACKLATTLILPKSQGLRAVVLFLLPLVEERKGALPLVVRAARSCAEQGFAALFFDYSGCGDSADDLTETSPAQLQNETERAFKWIQECFPEIPICVVGVRISSCIALELTARLPNEIAALVHWSPINGATFLRQLFQRRMVNDMVAYGKARENRKQLEENLYQGKTIDLDGFPLTPIFYQWLQSLEPGLAEALSDLPILLIPGGHDLRSAELFDSGHAKVSDLRYPPFWNTVGQVDLEPLITTTLNWLLRRFPETLSIKTLPQFQNDPSFPVIQSDTDKQIRLAIDCPQEDPREGILFLHGWSGDRTGPHRIFTRTARILKEKGCLCARVDFTGRGTSDGNAEDASIAQMVKDAEKAYLYLQKLLPDGVPITVIAICSGCKVAITLASNHPEIKQLVLWSAESMGSLRNPSTGLRKTLNALRTYSKKALKPETWKKIFQGKVNTKLVTKALVRHEVRSAEEAKQEDLTLKRFENFKHPILFLYGGSDPDAPGSTKAYSAFCKRHQIPYQLETIPRAGHSYYSEKWTKEVLAHTLAFLDSKKNS